MLKPSGVLSSKFEISKFLHETAELYGYVVVDLRVAGHIFVRHFRTTAFGMRNTVLVGGALLLSLVLLSCVERGMEKEIVDNVSDVASTTQYLSSIFMAVAALGEMGSWRTLWLQFD